MTDRINISLTEEEDIDLFRSVQDLLTADGRTPTNPKVVAMAARQMVDRRRIALRVWTDLMVGVTKAMEGIGAGVDDVRLIQWCNVLVQQVLAGSISSQQALKMAYTVDEMIRERKREQTKEYEFQLQEELI